MNDLDVLRAELERERRSLAMLPPQTPVSREVVISMIERCQLAIETARRIG